MMTYPFDRQKSFLRKAKLGFFLTWFLLSSCVSAPIKDLESRTYRRDLVFKINDVKARGLYVAPIADKYQIKVYIPSKPELLRIWNCHREVIVEKSGFFDRKDHTFYFYPTKGIETDDYCPIFIDALDVNGKNSWGFIEFQNRKLSATTNCNGEFDVQIGVSVCQSRIGLTQKISFYEPTEYINVSDCNDPIESTNFSYELSLSKDFCVYIFRGQKTGLFHRMVTFGYSDLLLKSISTSNQ